MTENEEIEIKENNEPEEEEEILSIPPEDITDVNDPEKKKKIICDFIIKQVIGEGTFATVRLAINKQTGEEVAIKIMEKSRIVQKEDKIRIDREIKVLKNLRHPNIVHLYSVIETDEKIYLIMEYAKGKELFDYIVTKKKLSESESCLFFQQIISGIEYLHKIKYVHRDIKPENLLINEETKELKIVDFGLSNIYKNPNKDLLSSACGSPSYAAPEMLNDEKYRAPPVDIWSSGIVLYAMICGYLPFDDDDNDILYDKICKGKFEIPNHVSDKAKDLLNKILVTDPKKRFTINQIKNHPWFSLYNNKGKLMISDGLILSKYVVPVDEDIVSNMNKEFNINEEKTRISILSNKHDDISTLYYLLLNKKINNKKKSVADIKSDLFKKYCENKNNLFENYDKDLNKVIEDRKDGYLNNLQDLSKSKTLSKKVTNLKKLLNSNETKKSDKKNNTIKINKDLSPENKTKKINILNTNRDSNKIFKTNDKKKISKFNTNTNVIKPKNIVNLVNKTEKKDLTERNKKENHENKIITKIRKNMEENNNNNEKRNLIKHREKKVHYMKKNDKTNNNKNAYNIRDPNKIKIQNNIKNSESGINNSKNNIKENRIKSAGIGGGVNKKKNINIKEKNENKSKDIKNTNNVGNNLNIKSKKNIKGKSEIININEVEKKDKKENLVNKNKNDKIDKIVKNKTPKKDLHNNKINIKAKINNIPLERKKTNDLNEKGEKKENIFNRTGGFSKFNKEIMLSEDSNKSKKILNIIYEKNNINKSQEKQKLKTFHTKNNLSQDIYHKLIEKPIVNQIKHFSSYNIKKAKNKLIKNIDSKEQQNKFIYFKMKNIPIFEMEGNDIIKESFSKIDDDSVFISNKRNNCYEPFDLNFAYIKPRKDLKEELQTLFDKNKVKYRSVGNTRYSVELKKENVVLDIKFDKLDCINDEKDNNIRISIIKLRKIKGNYQGDNIKGFEKILYKLK